MLQDQYPYKSESGLEEDQLSALNPRFRTGYLGFVAYPEPLFALQTRSAAL